MIKSFLWIVFLALGLQAAWGFALLGPLPTYTTTPLPATFGDAWQTLILDYGPGDVGGPKNIGEEYRRNTPVIYYAYDANFLGFFGSNGVSAVDSAVATFNSLTNVDSYSPDLSEFPLNSQSINYAAQSAGLVDLKSVAMSILMEQMGLAQPERFVWTLHDRYLPPGGTCPGDELYLVVQRNFNFMPTPLDQIQYSSYINGTLYSYTIHEYCQPPPVYQAVTETFSPEPYADTFTSVAGRLGGLNLGGFYTGLTRDDVGGLRYLLSTNNLIWESAALGSVLSSNGSVATSYGPPFVLYTSNYTAFAMAALTNNPAILTNLFPGLVVDNPSYYPVVIRTPIVVAYYTNSFVNGNPPVLVVTTNGYTDTVVSNYVETFGNLVIITNSYNTNTSAQLVTVQVSQGGVLGNPLVTNTTVKSITLTNVPSGDYFIYTNCGIKILYQLPVTNNVTVTTNVLVATSNSAGYFYSQSIVTHTTNHAYWAEPFICAGGGTVGATNATGLYQGVGQIQFVSAPYDSLLGQTFQPITNIYTMVVVSGSKAQNQTFQRVVTAPDIVFSAMDWADPNPAVPEIGVAIFGRNVNFNVNNILPNLAGPGTINPQSIITLNKVGDVYGNGSLAENSLGTNQFLSEFTQMKGVAWGSSPNTVFRPSGLLAWASFDSSTNDPVVYPNGASIQNLENQILIQISFSPSTTNLTLLNGTNGQPYTATTFTASGGAFTQPFTWSAAGLPAGLAVTTTNSAALLSGTPTQSGTNITYDFTLTLTDVIFRSVQWTFAITIQ